RLRTGKSCRDAMRFERPKLKHDRTYCRRSCGTSGRTGDGFDAGMSWRMWQQAPDVARDRESGRPGRGPPPKAAPCRRAPIRAGTSPAGRVNRGSRTVVIARSAGSLEGAPAVHPDEGREDAHPQASPPQGESDETRDTDQTDARRNKQAAPRANPEPEK